MGHETGKSASCPAPARVFGPLLSLLRRGVEITGEERELKDFDALAVRTRLIRFSDQPVAWPARRECSSVSILRVISS
jgi:hypothetical protein